MDMELLFRFRDLVAGTLQAHRDIIRAHGRCWWGWWKRPSEDGRTEVWQRLTDLLVEHGEVPVGLFDSGRGLVHRAWVTGVVSPRTDPSTGDLQPMPVTPREQVPPYYRDSPFSRAWLQISRIDPEPVDFFNHYSYAHAPPLLGLGHEEWLAGKVVADAAELRSMDTTIWEVRPRRAGDTQGRVLLAPRALTEPISTTPILLKHSAILHLTDLHFSVGKHRRQHRWRLESEPNDGTRTLSEAVNEALHVTRHGRIGLIIITGDLTFTGAADEFTEAFRSIERLLGMLDLGPDHLVIVPGNHDIAWAEPGHYSSESPVVRAPLEAKKHYMEFHQQIFRHRANHNLSMGRRYVMPHGGLLEVCALNSSALKTGQNFLAGMGRIDEAAFEEVKNKMRWEEGSLAFRMLAIHHHLTLTENLEHPSEYAKGFGIAIDAPRIQRLMARHGVQLAMHGHKHRAFVWRSRVYELPESNHAESTPGELSIVGGGSVGSTDVPGDANWFNVVQPGSAGVDLHMYRSEGAGIFSRQTRYFAEFVLEGAPRRLRLGEWRQFVAQ